MTAQVQVSDLRGFDHGRSVRFWLAARVTKKGPVLTGAVLVAIAVTLQAALGIWALLTVVPPALALMHQAMAMAVLTLTVIHVSDVMPQDALLMRLVLSPP